ncbi:MAG: class I SAM-dependent methyltransferase [Planctomycetes bacterium]|nr:class I SAM-dependent methyltransferase [Planctomycetota bacterium]
MSEPAWYERAFDAVYREVYPHRSDEQALAEVDFVLDLLGPEPAAPVLDLCCGHGRHALALNRRGFPVIGIDLSRDLLGLARRRRLDHSLFVRADMRRLPIATGTMAAAFSFFTSFGYFESSDEDLLVLQEIARVLRPDAPFLLDFLNAARVRRDLVPESRRRQAQFRIHERRSIDEASRRVLKDVEVLADDGRRHNYHESVRLYEPEELEALCLRAGLDVKSRLGDLAGEPHRIDSPRCVLHGLRPR